MTVTELRKKNDAESPESKISEDTGMDPSVTVRKKPIIGVLQVLAVIVLMVLAFIYSREPEQPVAIKTTENIPSTPSKPVPLVSILKPLISSQQLTITSTGSVAVRSYVTLTTQVSGRVIATSAALRSGGRFLAGETLVTLEQRDFTLALAQVQADVTSAQASLQLSQAEASVDISRATDSAGHGTIASCYRPS
jgi:hypothetical protein